MRQYLPAPPSALTGPLRDYLRQVQRALNSMPVLSCFSAVNPNSLVTGLPGDLTVNVGSASTDSRVWVLGGTDQSRLTTQGWVVLRTLSSGDAGGGGVQL